MAESEDTRPAIGIDLGTTNSRVGIWLDEENRFKLFSNDNGNQSTPSYVAFTETERLIGDLAKEQVSKNPANTIFDAKRLIGRRFSTLGTDSDKMHIQWPFRVACGKDDKPVIHVEYKGKEKVFSAEEVYAMILGQMKDLAEVSSGSVVYGASVSVPHCFNSAQRLATRNACSMAGLETVILVNEPVCAALAYTLASSPRPSLGEKKVLMFDLGGGSLDVTLVSIEEGVIEVKATSGDSQLGGEDFDLRLLHHFIQEIQEKHERDITSHPRVVRRLKKQVERVKVALSSDLETTIEIDALLEDFDFYSRISRTCFEEMNADFWGKCIKCVEECLQRAQMEKDDVYEVVMIGGSTRIPKVQQLLAEFFNDEAKLKKATDEAVVCGAAIRSGISCGYKTFADYLVVDVAPMSLGLETVGGAMHVMHPRSFSIPKSCEELFTTCYDNQSDIFLQIYEGENPQACGNTLIATMELSGIPPAPCGVPQILVRFDIDADGILTALAKDKTTGQKVEMYMEDIDFATSRVNDDDERRQRFPIQVYHGSENPHDRTSPSGPHESSNFNANSLLEPRGSIAIPLDLIDVPPQAAESSIAVENSSLPLFTCESSNTVKSRSSEPLESRNIFETTVEGLPQPLPALESNDNVESRSLKTIEPPLACEPVEFSEPPQEYFESSSVVEGEPLEKTQFYSFSNTVEIGAGEFSAPPPPPQVHGLSSYEIRPHGLPDPCPALRSSGIQEISAEVLAEPVETQLPKLTPESSQGGDLSAQPRANESSIAAESKPQEFSQQRQAYGSSKALESGPDVFSAFSPVSMELEDRPHEHSEPHGVISYESKELELPVPSPGSCTQVIRSDEFSVPPPAFGSSNSAAIRSDELSVPSPALGSSNSAEIRSQEFSASIGSSNSVESSSHISLVHRIIETVHVIASIEDFHAQKKDCSTFIRRANMLVPLFMEFRNSDVSFSEAAVTCFSAFEAALSTAKALLLLCNEGSKLYLTLEQRKVAEQFSLLNTALIQALDKIPSSLEISEEIREQVDLVHSQLRRSKGTEDAVDSQLYTELTSVLDETNGRPRSPFQLTRLAESFKLDKATSLRKEFQALRGMMTEKEPPLDALVNQREFDQVYGLLVELRDLYPLHEDLPPQGHGSSKVVESSSQGFSAPPPPPPPMSGSDSPQAFEPRILQGASAPPPPGSSVERKPPTEDPQVYRSAESKPEESPPPQVYKSSLSFEDRSYNEAPQVYRPSKTFASRPYESLEAFTSPRSSNASESRSQEFPDTQDERVPSGSSGSRRLESSELSPMHKSGKGLLSRLLEHSSEALQSHESSTIPENRRLESSELSPAHKSGDGQESRPREYSSGPIEAYETNNTSRSRPDEASATPRLSSKQYEPAVLSPVYRSSNASESSRPVSSEHTYKSSSSSDMSSIELSDSGLLRNGEWNKAPELQLQRSATTEPLNHANQEPENVRSVSLPDMKISDSIIEDVVKKYTWDQVLEMTDNLTSRKLGKGGFGVVYLAKLENRKEVAVKILDASSQQGISEFLNEVNLLKRVNHVNLITLLGYCQDERQVLIYEFAREGSIWDHLQAGGTSIDWKQRLKIALQSACGLEYLHTGCRPRIIHRDIKSQNILLTESMVAKVADFGLSKLGADQENLNKTHVTTMVKGTLGYLDPEYLKTGQLTEKSDVYSFGVILMEIITGRKPIQTSEKRGFIGDWVEEHYNPNAGSRGVKPVADPRFGGHYNPKALKRVIEVARKCIQQLGSDRPEMTDVVRLLRKAQSEEEDEKKASKWLPSFIVGSS